MATKNEVIGELEKTYSDFHAKIQGLDDLAWEEVWLGKWSTNHLLAHMAGWAKEMTKGIERVKAGERPTPEGVSYADADLWNAKFSSTASPGKYSVPSFEHAIKQYIQAAKDLPESFYGESEDGKAKIGNRLLQGAGIHHFGEHGAQLDAWLASRK